MHTYAPAYPMNNIYNILGLFADEYACAYAGTIKIHIYSKLIVILSICNFYALSLYTNIYKV